MTSRMMASVQENIADTVITANTVGEGMHAKSVDNGPAIPQQTSEKHFQMLPTNNLDIVTPVKVVE